MVFSKPKSHEDVHGHFASSHGEQPSLDGLPNSAHQQCGQNDITLTMNYVRPGDGEVLFFTEKRSGISERSIELTPSACFANQVINERTWNEQVGILIDHKQSIKGEVIVDNTRNISTHEESRCLHSFDLQRETS